MRDANTTGKHLLGVVLPLVLGLYAVATFSAALPLSAAFELTSSMYLPFAARPIPTPTLTPTLTRTPTPTRTPTVTSTPVPLDVRVEWSCCNVWGGSREDPNGEYVCFKNYDWRPADVTDWRVRDEQEHEYRFPHFILDPDAIVRLHSGAGRDTATELHWASGLVWNNSGDVIHLYDAEWCLIDRYVY